MTVPSSGCGGSTVRRLNGDDLSRGITASILRYADRSVGEWAHLTPIGGWYDAAGSSAKQAGPCSISDFGGCNCGLLPDPAQVIVGAALLMPRRSQRFRYGRRDVWEMFLVVAEHIPAAFARAAIHSSRDLANEG